MTQVTVVAAGGPVAGEAIGEAELDELALLTVRVNDEHGHVYRKAPGCSVAEYVGRNAGVDADK